MPIQNASEKDFLLQSPHTGEPAASLPINSLKRNLLVFTFRTDAQGSLIDGPDLLEHLGYAPPGPGLVALVHPDDKNYLNQILAQTAANVPFEKVHFRLADQSGRWHFLAASARVCGESPAQIDFVVQDITEERTEKQNLLLSFQQLRQLMEKSRDVIFQIDMCKWTFVYISPSISNLTGYEPAELENLSLAEIIEIFVHPDEKDSILRQFEAVLSAPETLPAKSNAFIFRIRHRNGKIYRIESQFFPRLNAQGQLAHLQGFFRDITQTEQLKFVLDESLENYRNIVENTPSLFALLEPSGTFKFASGQWQKLVGYFPEDLLQNSLLRLIHAEDQEMVAKILEKLAVAPGNYTGLKYRLMTKNGETSWQLANLASINKQNEVGKIYFISNDITRLETAKLALNHRLEFETMLTQISKDALAVPESRQFIERSLKMLGVGTGVDRVFLYINMNEGRYARLECEWPSDSGYSLAGNVLDYSGLEFWKSRLEANEIIDYTILPDEHARLVQSGLISRHDPRTILLVPLSIQQRFYGLLGFENYQIARTWPAEDIDLIRMAAHILEIRLEKDIEATHRQLIEQQLLESEKKYRQIVTEVPIGILHLRTSGSILDANPYTLKMFNIDSADELHQVRIKANFPESGETDLISYIIAQVQRLNLVKNHEIHTHRNDSKPMTLQLSASIQRESTQSWMINAVLEDVTEPRSLEQQLLQAQKMESIGMLAGGIAHDFNNLMGGIIGYASLILNEIDPETNPIYWDIENILNISKRATELTNQLMTFSRSNRFQTRPCQVNWVIDEVVTLLSRTIDKAIEIHTDTAKDLKLVLADSGQLQQAILNICINARDAISEKGTIRITTRNVELGSDFVENHLNARFGPCIRISIADNGMGMDEKIRSRIFEPFFTTKERTGGTGLGLAVTYGIINHHQGFIEVTSEEGKGTQFDIYLPVTEAETEIIPEEPVSGVFSGVETILVIDDEEIIRNISRRILERVGYRVLLAGSGYEAIDLYAVHSETIDLVLLDLVMPKMSGVEVFNALVKINPAINVLVSSGYAEEALVVELKSKGVEHFIQKPFQPDELLAEVRVCLEEHRK